MRPILERSSPWYALALRLEHPFEAAYARYRQAEALLGIGAPRQQAEAALRPARQTTVRLGAAPLRREIELLAQRGRLRLEEPGDTTVSPEVPPSPAAALGLTQREVEVLALVAEGRTNRRSARRCTSPPRPPASTSQGSWPSSGSPVAARRPRSPTGPASTSNDPPWPWPLDLTANVADQSATTSRQSPWQRRLHRFHGSGFSLLA
jgi:hypothetical protein